MAGSLQRAEDGRCVVPNVMRTENMLERMRGLLGRSPLQPGQGMLIDPCAAVHAIGMTYPLDLVFLSAGGQIMKLVQSLKPWRMATCAGARMVLELPAGTIAGQEMAAGQTLNWANA